MMHQVPPRYRLGFDGAGEGDRSNDGAMKRTAMQSYDGSIQEKARLGSDANASAHSTWRPEATSDRILFEAARLFAQRGFHGTSTRQIARNVGVQQPTLFHHFDSKRAIMERLLVLQFHQAVEYATAMLGADGSGAARLYSMLRHDLRNVLKVPHDLSGTVDDYILHGPEFREWGIKLAKLHKVWRALIEEGIREGDFVPYDASLVELTIDGVFKEVIRTAARHNADDNVPSPDELVRFMLRALLVNPHNLDKIAAEADHLNEGTPITL